VIKEGFCVGALDSILTRTRVWSEKISFVLIMFIVTLKSEAMHSHIGLQTLIEAVMPWVLRANFTIDTVVRLTQEAPLDISNQPKSVTL